MKNNPLTILAIAVLAFFIIDTFVPGGGLIIYPIKLFVTFLHEFGHAIGAVVTGGDVQSLQVNSDGSGVTWTAGGNRGVILMGGYIGSAIFGNLLLYLGIRKPEVSKYLMIAIAILMVTCSTIWYSSAGSFLINFLFALAMVYIAIKTGIAHYVLIFIGAVSVLHIISDFNVGPSSDLNAYAQVMGLTQTIWMYIWLVIVLVMTYINVKAIIRQS